MLRTEEWRSACLYQVVPYKLIQRCNDPIWYELVYDVLVRTVLLYQITEYTQNVSRLPVQVQRPTGTYS